VNEAELSRRLAKYTLANYPEVAFRVDMFPSMKLTPQQILTIIKIHGRHSKGYPDYQILSGRGGYGALFLELKLTKLYNSHTQTQAAYHKMLRKQGFRCKFCYGLKDCIKKLNKYMKLKANHEK